MRADEVIDLRKTWAKYNYGPFLPEATVLAEADWLAYVQAMTTTIPEGEKIVLPVEEDVKWAWPNGVTIVFAHPVPINHTIISEDAPGGAIRSVTPHAEAQSVRCLAIGPLVSPALRTDKLAAVTGTRPERRRAERELPSLRVLELSSGASVAERGEGGSVEWSHR